MFQMNNLIKLLPKSIYVYQYKNVNTLSPLATAFNSRPDAFHKHTLFAKRTGLFGEPKLMDSSGFYLLQESAILESDTLLAECCSPGRRRKLVEVFDNLSNCLCKVADLAEFIRMAHPSINYSRAAENACIAIGGLVEKLNTNRPLYDSLNHVIQHGDLVPTSEVDNHVASLFLFDFEQSGIHLEEYKRKRVADLNEKILTLGQQFLKGTLDPRAITKNKLPEEIRHQFVTDGDNVVIGGMFSDSSQEVTREAAYKVFLHPDEDQEERLQKLLAARHEMASLCGFPSFAHRAMRGSLAETPDLVCDFLSDLSKGVRMEAQNELSEMSQMKKQLSKSSKSLAPWDISYLTGVARHNNLPSDLIEGLSSYLSLGTVMDGLNNLFTDLFNISLKVEEPMLGELWTNDVYKVAVYRDSSELLGYIYCDFFEHHRKSHQDCHFTIRGGKILEDESYQNPVVVLHLNLPNPTWSSPCLLSLSMMENLFHEMGHAVHSMLARTRYQHVTGTRCSTDFAEVPSILMEFFANDARVLHRFATHYKTGEKLPLPILEKVLASRYTFAAIELQLQTFYSLLDQRFHSSERWSRSTTTTDVLAEVQAEHSVLPYVPNTAWQLRFGHLVGYGAKYYSYMMSRAVASWIWQQHFKENPFNRDAGLKLVEEVLRHGGGKPPINMVAEFLGKKVTSGNLVSALMKDLYVRKEKLAQANSR